MGDEQGERPAASGAPGDEFVWLGDLDHDRIRLSLHTRPVPTPPATTHSFARGGDAATGFEPVTLTGVFYEYVWCFRQPPDCVAPDSGERHRIVHARRRPPSRPG